MTSWTIMVSLLSLRVDFFVNQLVETYRLEYTTTEPLE